MVFFTMLTNFYGSSSWVGMDQAWGTILHDLMRINGRCVALGKIRTQNGWQMTAETSKFYASYLAMVYIATNIFPLEVWSQRHFGKWRPEASSFEL